MSNTIVISTMSRSEVYQNIAEKFKPVVYLHPTENYFPCTIEWYLERCSLWEGKAELSRVGTLNTSNIPTGPKTQKMNLDAEQSARPGMPKRALEQVPFYTHVNKNADGDWQIFYIFLYAYNGALWLCGVPEKTERDCSCFQVGGHQADIEHMTVIVDAVTERPKRFYYAAHGSNAGKWLNPDEIQLWEGSHPVVYSAKHSHASYWLTGTICRCLGCISDHTGQGERWYPPVQLIDENTQWNLFQGDMGAPDYVSTPQYQRWWKQDDETSTNWCCREFCACY